ncbi:unnamed protein product, partial [Polarella glacialis]
ITAAAVTYLAALGRLELLTTGNFASSQQVTAGADLQVANLRPAAEQQQQQHQQHQQQAHQQQQPSGIDTGLALSRLEFEKAGAYPQVTSQRAAAGIDDGVVAPQQQQQQQQRLVFEEKLQELASAADREDEVAHSRLLWERRWQQLWPGQAWGSEPKCQEWQASIRPRDFRSTWVEERLRGLPAQSGVEIGACQLRVSMPDNVQMRYVDKSADAEFLKSQCFAKDGAQRPDIVDDATRLALIEDESFDLLVAAHVLEHMQDVLGTLRHWLRVVKKGGLVFLALPDLCDFKYPFGDRLRLVATPAHFVEEFQDQNASRRNFEGHVLEQGVSVAGIDSLRAASGLPALNRTGNLDLESITRNFVAMNADADRLTTKMTVPLNLAYSTMEHFGSYCADHPHNVHFHLWTRNSMHGMLSAATELFRPLGLTFVVEELHTAGRTEYNMQELRVALRRTG